MSIALEPPIRVASNAMRAARKNSIKLSDSFVGMTVRENGAPVERAKAFAFRNVLSSAASPTFTWLHSRTDRFASRSRHTLSASPSAMRFGRN